VSALPPATPPLRLAEHPFFHGVGDDLVARLGRRAEERGFDTGELLVREGDPADEFLLLFSGKVAIELGPPDRPGGTIQTVGPGEVVGWSWLLPPYRWRLDARALKPTRALALPAEDVRAALDERPADGYRFLLKLLPVVAQRLENTQLQLLDLHGR
jgi:CRP/FNR family transcriptional regulator, cyclic AMP receptor protein